MRGLPQGIVLKQKTTLYAVDGSWIGTPSLSKGKLLDARSMQQSWEPKDSFDAARLVIKPVLLVVLLGELFPGGPGLGPYGRVLDPHLVFERGRPRPRPSLDEVKVLTRALKVSLRTEVGHIDDEGVALPMAARVAIPLRIVAGRCRLRSMTMLRCQPCPWPTS